MKNKIGNGNEEGPSSSVNVGFINGNNNINNTINVAHSKTVINNINVIEEISVEDITLNCSSASSCFKGRTEILSNVFQNIKSNKMVVIHGAPGIGKTETARQFAVKNNKYFNRNLIWIFAETQQNIQKCFKDLSTTLGLKVTDVSQIYGKFRSSGCLFIFDNVENMDNIQQYLPNNELHPNIKIIITSQFSQWDSSVCQIPLEALKMKDALEILEHKLGDKYGEYPTEIWKDLVEHLEGIPLSIQIVSSLIQEELSKVRISKFYVQQFICGLKENFINAEIPKFEIFNYTSNSEKSDATKTVFNSIRFALERLKKKDASLSLDLLRFVAYLDADYIYHNNLICLPSIDKSEEKLETALTILKQYSLIQVEYIHEYCLKIKIHRTIQHVLRKFDLNEQNGSMFKTAIKTLLSDEMFFHFHSIFKYVKEKEFQVKSLEFYYDNYIENTSLGNSYLKKLAYFHCYVVLQELLPKFKEEYSGTDDYNKILNELLSNAIENKYNNMLVIDLLINYGAKIELLSYKKEQNGFHFASSWLSTELLDRLLESNDSENIIHSRNYYGQTILHVLVEKCNEENIDRTIKCMEHLISKWNANISIRVIRNDTILHSACQNSKICLQMITYFVEECNCKNLVNIRNAWGATPLHYLLHYNLKQIDLFQIISYFINECGADITIQDNRKWNSVFYVCYCGTSEIVELVLKSRNCRQFINSQDELGDVAFTQLFYNRRIKEQEIIELMKLFIANEMDFKIRNNENKTLIEIAADNKLTKLSVELKKHLNRLWTAISTFIYWMVIAIGFCNWMWE